MDLCEHGSLLDAIERRAQGAAGGAFAETEIRGAMRDLLLALAHLHGDNGTRSIPLAHRVVKPENILVGPPPPGEGRTSRDLVCKLCDFGQAATTLSIKQTFQRFDARLHTNNGDKQTISGKITADTMSFDYIDRTGKLHKVVAKVEGDRLMGTVSGHPGVVLIGNRIP
jgi:serine/threonine protein kinase